MADKTGTKEYCRWYQGKLGHIPWAENHALRRLYYLGEGLWVVPGEQGIRIIGAKMPFELQLAAKTRERRDSLWSRWSRKVRIRRRKAWKKKRIRYQLRYFDAIPSYLYGEGKKWKVKEGR